MSLFTPLVLPDRQEGQRRRSHRRPNKPVDYTTPSDAQFEATLRLGEEAEMKRKRKKRRMRLKEERIRRETTTPPTAPAKSSSQPPPPRPLVDPDQSCLIPKAIGFVSNEDLDKAIARWSLQKEQLINEENERVRQWHITNQKEKQARRRKTLAATATKDQAESSERECQTPTRCSDWPSPPRDLMEDRCLQDPTTPPSLATSPSREPLFTLRPPTPHKYPIAMKDLALIRDGGFMNNGTQLGRFFISDKVQRPFDSSSSPPPSSSRPATPSTPPTHQPQPEPQPEEPADPVLQPRQWVLDHVGVCCAVDPARANVHVKIVAASETKTYHFYSPVAGFTAIMGYFQWLVTYELLMQCTGPEDVERVLQDIRLKRLPSQDVLFPQDWMSGLLTPPCARIEPVLPDSDVCLFEKEMIIRASRAN